MPMPRISGSSGGGKLSCSVRARSAYFSALRGSVEMVGTVGRVSRYTPPSEPSPPDPYHRRPRWVRFGVWMLLLGVVALVFVDIIAAFL